MQLSNYYFMVCWVNLFPAFRDVTKLEETLNTRVEGALEFFKIIFFVFMDDNKKKGQKCETTIARKAFEKWINFWQFFAVSEQFFKFRQIYVSNQFSDKIQKKNVSISNLTKKIEPFWCFCELQLYPGNSRTLNSGTKCLVKAPL